MRPTLDYTPYYCEENAWRLCAHPSMEGQDADVIFISNPARSCAIWSQRAAFSPDEPVLWDYHVVVLTRGADGPQLWDLDNTLGAPLPFMRWWEASFPYRDQLVERVQPMFRVVARARFLEVFCSDRSHMLVDGQWSAPPPPWPPIGAGPSNLMRFVAMTPGFEGRVMTRGELEAYVGHDG
jgi:protein N-terminal glutamine amidohydrolase